jgi:hypothetical protein
VVLRKLLNVTFLRTSPVLLNIYLVLTFIKKTLVTELTNRWLSELWHGVILLFKVCSDVLLSFNELRGLLHIREVRNSEISAQRLRLLWLRSVILFRNPEKFSVYRVFILSDKYRLIFSAVLSYPIQLTVQTCGGIAAGGDIRYLSDIIMAL